MMQRVTELCRLLKPVLGKRIDRLYRTYLAGDVDDKADIEQTLELLAARHLSRDFEPDRSPFPPPPEAFSRRGDVPLGSVIYGGRERYPFHLQAGRLKEHLLVAGRSGSGKTNLTFILMLGMMQRGIKVLALDWKRGYRDLLPLQSDLRVHTIGRDVSPFRFNPLIPPPGTEPHVWAKLIVDVMANAYLGGEGVISLFIAGLDHLYRQFGVFDRSFPLATSGNFRGWPTVQDLLVWLRSVKLKGRAAMWQASAERILLAMSYGEFASVLNTQDNSHVLGLLDHNVVLEMDGLSSSSDRVMFSEALTLYLYRYRMALGPRPRNELSNIIVLEEAHNLLLAKAPGSKESVLETSIRMIRQYGLGYVFVDQSASLLSKVAFANNYAVLALSQKLRSDVQAMAGAMNLTDEQKEALNTLPVGSVVVRLADEHPEPFLIRVPRCPVKEGSVSDADVRQNMAAYSRGDFTDTAMNSSSPANLKEIPGVPSPDKDTSEITEPLHSHPPPPEPPEFPEPPEVEATSPGFVKAATHSPGDSTAKTRFPVMSRDMIRFLVDVATRPLSTTVARYQRLNLSRRRGNAIRQQLTAAGVIEAVAIATRSGQVVLYDLTDPGRQLCVAANIDAGSRPRASLEHRYWVAKGAEHFEKLGYTITHEHVIAGNGAVDIVADRPGEHIAVEVETGKSDIPANITKVASAGFDRLVLIATCPEAIGRCQKAIAELSTVQIHIELTTWLDIS